MVEFVYVRWKAFIILHVTEVASFPCRREEEVLVFLLSFIPCQTSFQNPNQTHRRSKPGQILLRLLTAGKFYRPLTHQATDIKKN